MMASVLQRPRSPFAAQASGETTFEYNQSQPRFSHTDDPAEPSTINDQFLPSSPNDASTLVMSAGNDLGEQLANLQKELLGDALGTSSSDLSTGSQLDKREANGSGHYSAGFYGAQLNAGEGSGEVDREGSSRAELDAGLLDEADPLGLLGSSSQLDADLELQAAAQALASQHPNDISTSISDFDPSSTGTFQFPELPASLLDQAPEYEYSLHTQTNVFDAVQEYNQADEDQAARIFQLDSYDPALLDLNQSGNIQADGYWGYQDASAGGTLQQATIPTDLAAFQDSSSLSEYPEPSTAPTSRASDWKQDPWSGAMHASFPQQGQDYAQKRRRGSFDSEFHIPPRGADHISVYGQSVPQQQVYYAIAPDDQYTADPRHPHNGYNMPAPIYSNNGRTRIASWGGEGSGSQYADDWPPPPAPAPGFVNHPQGHQQFHEGFVGQRPSTVTVHHPQYQPGPFFHQHPDMMQTASVFGQAPGPTGVPLTNDAMAARMGSMPSSSKLGNQHMVEMARSSSQNEMINALGSAMDASMESEGVAKCPYPDCTKTFAKNRSYNLKAHLRSHSQLKPFACSHCPRAFSRKHDLERHARVHSGDKPYICEACGKGFPRSDALRRHWRVEKECGEKAVEIEAGQPLPSLPPGVNTVAAQTKVPMPGMMPGAGPMATASAPMDASSVMLPQQQVQQRQYWSDPNAAHNSFMDSYSFSQPDRKRARE